jgi:carbon-monoxide dehydrogenase large subunit
VSDMTLPGLLHVAFVRSPFAHARLRGIDAEAARRIPGVVAVLTGDDPEVAAVTIRARSELASYVETAQPVLTWPKVRFAGEAVAAVVAVDRYVAEDGAELVEVDYDPLPVVVDPLSAVEPGCPAVVHDEAPDNVFLRRRFEAGDVDAALAGSALVLERTYRTNRHAGVPLEGRGGVALWDAGERSLTLWSGTQIPHVVRHGVAELLGLPERSVRVVAPDVGGAFGVKAALYPEDIALCLLARRLERPVKWVEDRSEHLLAAHHARHHVYRVKAGFDAGGRITALAADITCNAGAYSPYPFTAGLEPLMAGGLLAGPYKVANYRSDVAGVATNTSPAGAYRGVARPATVFVMERLLDSAASRLGLDPVAIRRANLIGPDDIPYKSATRLVHDSRTYVACLDEVLERVGYGSFRAEQDARRHLGDQGRLVGIGLAVYNELTGLGRAASAGPRMPFRTGHEVVTVRLDPSGGVTVLTGASSQGQGIETTFSQIAAEALGVPYESVEVRLGDTAAGGFGFGAFSSRQGVIGGGAVLRASEAVRDKVLRIAAHLLEAAEADLRIEDGRISTVDAPAVRAVTVAEVARVAYLESHRLPPEVEPGLEATRSYDPVRGTFAAGAQAAVVEVDPGTGAVKILRFVCVEDAGRVYHPQIVEGQVEGAIAQGIGGALYEHHVYDDNGQLLTATLLDYLLPTAMEIPPLELGHIQDPSHAATGARGVGEGGTLGPAAALANAVVDALSPFGAELDELPLTPDRIHAALNPLTPAT